MDEEYRGRTFKSGNSVALRLPKGMGITEGTDIRMVRDAGCGFRLEPLDALPARIDVSKFWGKAPEMAVPGREDFDDPPRVWDRHDWPHPHARG